MTPLLLASMAMLTTGAYVVAPPPATASAPISAPFDYDKELARLIGGATDVNYEQLRLASTRQPGFNAYNTIDWKNLSKALEMKDWLGLRRLTEAHLKGEYLDPNAHFYLAQACRNLKDDACAARHFEIRKGLLSSIGQTGDGHGPDTVFVVIGVDEEYAILRAGGFKFEMVQNFRIHEGRPYDVLKVSREGSKITELWFYIGSFLGRKP